MADFKFDDGGKKDEPVGGSPEGDGDFETDELPSTNETSSGGQLDTGEAEKGESKASRHDVPGPQQHTGLERVIDEVSSGKLQP